MTDGRGIVPALVCLAGAVGALRGAWRALWRGTAPMFSRGGTYLGDATGRSARVWGALYLCFGVVLLVAAHAFLAGWWDAT